MMRILAPADGAREAVALIEAGAGMLYFGYQPEGWLREHAPLESFNRRAFAAAQVTTEGEAARLLDEAR
jgi:hypothetical protein